MIEAIIFDMDGVIVDSIRRHYEIWSKVLKEYDVELTYEQWRPFIGVDGETFIKKLCETRGLKLDYDSIVQTKREKIGDLYDKGIILFDGARELLSELKAGGYKIGLASSEWRENVMRILKKFSIDEFFTVILGKEDIKRRKPAPDVYIKAAKMLEADPAKCIVLEDSLSGLTAAKAAGMRCIAVETSFRKEELTEADLIVENVKEKEKIIAFINSN